MRLGDEFASRCLALRGDDREAFVFESFAQGISHAFCVVDNQNCFHSLLILKKLLNLPSNV